MSRHDARLRKLEALIIKSNLIKNRLDKATSDRIKNMSDEELIAAYNDITPTLSDDLSELSDDELIKKYMGLIKHG
jgi:hypothetical protein